MAISEVCQFEAKEEIDRICEEKKTSRRKAQAILHEFYNRIGINVALETIRTKDKRARTAVGSNEPKESQPTETITNSTPTIIENRKPQGGGAREGAGRPKTKDPLDSTVDVSEESIGKDDDSKNLFHLKQYWRKANKKDRSSFRRWINAN